MEQEAVWITEIRKGNQQAFKAVYGHYADRIFFLSRRFHLSESDAREIVQSVFLVLWSKRENLKDGLSLNAYLLTIAKNKIINLNKRRATEAAAVNAYLRRKEGCTSEDENNVVFNDLEIHTLQFIGTLPGRKREIFLLSRIKGMDNEAIAHQLNLSRRTVENNIYQAELAIRRYLKDNKLLERSFILIIAYIFS